MVTYRSIKPSEFPPSEYNDFFMFLEHFRYISIQFFLWVILHSISYIHHSICVEIYLWITELSKLSKSPIENKINKKNRN